MDYTTTGLKKMFEKKYDKYELHKKVRAYKAPQWYQTKPTKPVVQSKYIDIRKKIKDSGNFKEAIKKEFGISSEEFNKMQKAYQGQGISESKLKELEKKYNMSLRHFPEIKECLEGKREFTKKIQKAVDKGVRRLQRLHVQESKYTREKEEMAESLANRRTGKESLKGVITTEKNTKVTAEEHLGVKNPFADHKVSFFGTSKQGFAQNQKPGGAFAGLNAGSSVGFGLKHGEARGLAEGNRGYTPGISIGSKGMSGNNINRSGSGLGPTTGMKNSIPLPGLNLKK